MRSKMSCGRRSTFEPYFEVDTDDKSEIAARIEPYFWDPVTVVLDNEDRSYVLETGRHRFQIYEKGLLESHPHPSPLPPSRGEGDKR